MHMCACCCSKICVEIVSANLSALSQWCYLSTIKQCPFAGMSSEILNWFSTIAYFPTILCSCTPCLCIRCPIVKYIQRINICTWFDAQISEYGCPLNASTLDVVVMQLFVVISVSWLVVQGYLFDDKQQPSIYSYICIYIYIQYMAYIYIHTYAVHLHKNLHKMQWQRKSTTAHKR